MKGRILHHPRTWRMGLLHANRASTNGSSISNRRRSRFGSEPPPGSEPGKKQGRVRVLRFVPPGFERAHPKDARHFRTEARPGKHAVLQGHEEAGGGNEKGSGRTNLFFCSWRIHILMRGLASSSRPGVREVIPLVFQVIRPDRPSMGCIELMIRSGDSQAKYSCVEDHFHVPWPIDMADGMFNVTATAQTELGHASVEQVLQVHGSSSTKTFWLDFGHPFDRDCPVQDFDRSFASFRTTFPSCLYVPTVEGPGPKENFSTRKGGSSALALAFPLLFLLFKRLAGPKNASMVRTTEKVEETEMSLSSSYGDSETSESSTNGSKSDACSAMDTDKDDSVICMQRLLPKSKRLLLKSTIKANGYIILDSDDSSFSLE